MGRVVGRIVRRLTEFSMRRPGTTIGAWVLAVGAVIGLAATVGGTFADDLAAHGSQSEKATNLLAERFPTASDGSAMAVFAAPEGQRLDRFRPAVDAAVARIGTTAKVTKVSDPFASGTISPDGRIGFAEIVFDRPSRELGLGPITAIVKTLEPARTAGLTAELGGEAAYVNAAPPSSGTEAVGLLVALVVLVVAFGTVMAALVPIALALVAVAAGLAAITLLADTMDVATGAPTIAAMIGLGVGIDYALFITVRYRENRVSGQDNATALTNAMRAGGPTVVFAGGTVVLAMTALTLTGLGVLTTLGLSTALVVVIAVATALTLLPALLSLLGDRIDRGRLPGRRRRVERPEHTLWWRFAHRVSGKPLRYLFAASAVLIVLAMPALKMQTTFPDSGSDSASTTDRRAFDLLAEGFGPGVNAPLVVVADLREASTDVPALSRRIAADPGIATVGKPLLSPTGDTVVLTTVPTTAPSDPATSRTLERVRALLPPNVSVTGLTAMTDDLTRQLDKTLPVFLAAILTASFLLLLLVFRSVVIPLKAALTNLLSIGAAYGVIVAVFQWGWLKSVFGLDATTPIASPLPTIFFAVLFGLSMDYEVFLLSRVREEYEATGDTTESVARGIAATGRVITSAALIMTAVFLGFVADSSPIVKMLGLGLATAIALDATLVRVILVPATMSLLGSANWWFPGRRTRPAAPQDGMSQSGEFSPTAHGSSPRR
ncbi:MMPL family transporter [Catenulispora yoronensis]|uniref:MMPL family transporter n=1 Tax=Catenulispora yoronensis TaxID=450799 RepID=A0ABN2TIC7_9ACTN